MRVALFVTCLVDAMFPEAGKATVGLLERLGHQVSFPAGQTCCGQPAFNAGFTAFEQVDGGVWVPRREFPLRGR